jgi:hypothetical protein
MNRNVSFLKLACAKKYIIGNEMDIACMKALRWERIQGLEGRKVGEEQLKRSGEENR